MNSSHRLAAVFSSAVLALSGTILAGARPIGAVAADQAAAPPAAQGAMSREAAASSVEADLKLEQIPKALATYDRYVKATGKPDPALLGQIARADLARIRQQNRGTLIEVEALEVLARDGNAVALQDLKQAARYASGKSPTDAAPILALARLGDKDAIETLGTWVDERASDPGGQIIRMVEEVGARNLAPKIASHLSDTSPQVRSAAARAMGTLQYAAAVPRLREIFQNDAPIVRMFAAASLKQLGDGSADAYLAQALKTEIPQARLIAAAGYRSAATTQWIPPVRELLGDRDLESRFKAAELLACCDASAARGALVRTLESENPFMRAEAARILESTGLADLPLARRLLGDSADAVRVRGAAAALRRK